MTRSSKASRKRSWRQQRGAEREFERKTRELTEDEAHNVDKIMQASSKILAVLAPDAPANLRESRIVLKEISYSLKEVHDFFKHRLERSACPENKEDSHV